MIKREKGTEMKAAVLALCTLMVGLLAPLVGQAQARGQGGPRPTARLAAPIDLTGYWVSVVTEDWRFRMVTPPKGDYMSVPLNAEGKKVADAWDPAKDRAAGESCKAYGAAALMRVPSRVRIGWQDDMTLKVDTDAGEQTRFFRFGPPPHTASGSGPRGRQGVSAASWEGAGGIRGGTLKVITTEMRAGYLRSNGVPYSENALLTEYYDRHREPDGTEWFTVTTIVSDPTYLAQEFITTSHFRKEPDGTKWAPSPCEVP